MEPLEHVSNNVADILYYMSYTLKLTAKNEEHKKILTKTRMTLRDLEKIKINLKSK